MDCTAYIGKDGAVYFRARSEIMDGEDGRALGDSFDRIGPGEERAGRTFEEWHKFLQARGGAARLKV